MATGDRLKWFLEKLGDVNFVTRAQESEPLPEEEAPEGGVNPIPPPVGAQPPAPAPLGAGAFSGIGESPGANPMEEPVLQDQQGNSPLRDKVKFMALMNKKSGAKPNKAPLLAGGTPSGY